jgi:hypothetical protein
MYFPLPPFSSPQLVAPSPHPPSFHRTFADTDAPSSEKLAPTPQMQLPDTTFVFFFAQLSMAFSLKEGACLLTLACVLSPAACFTTSLPSPLRCSAAKSSSEQQTRHVSRSAVLRNLFVSASLWGGIPRRAGALSLQAQDSSPFAAVYDAVGRWLADHPAPLWLVNNPVKKWLATRCAILNECMQHKKWLATRCAIE